MLSSRFATMYLGTRLLGGSTEVRPTCHQVDRNQKPSIREAEAAS